jgi:putative flippase GtrA
MLSKLKTHFLELIWPQRVFFMKYAVVGSSGFLLDMLLLKILKEHFGIRPLFGVLISQAVVLLYIFLLNKYWSFNTRQWQHIQAIKFGTLASFNYLFGFAMMYFLNEKLEIHYLIVRGISLVFIVSWNFLLYRYWVYK